MIYVDKDIRWFKYRCGVNLYFLRILFGVHRIEGPYFRVKWGRL